MKTLSLSSRSRLAGPAVRRPQRGFTLVEMLVVIGIIAALAALAIPAVMTAMKHAKVGVIKAELSDFELSLKSYKEKYGEYPPDFAGVLAGNAAARQAVLRHFAKTYPRYQPGVMGSIDPDPWVRFADDVSKCWHLDVNNLSPSTAMTFFLGGRPDWYARADGTLITPGTPGWDPNKPIKGFLGFCPAPTNPFGVGTKPLHNFDIGSVGWTGNGFACWPKVQNVSDKTSGPIVYFRAEGENYTVDGTGLNNPPRSPAHSATTNAKYMDFGGGVTVYPAVDTRLSNFLGIISDDPAKAVVYTWVNPQSFQLFASGLDQKYVRPYIAGTVNDYVDCVAYPTGESYSDPNTHTNSFDDITNFSHGTLDSDLP